MTIVIIFIILFIIVAGIVFYLYKPTANTKKFVINNEFTDSNASDIQLILFYVSWCPHSKDALNKWNEMKNKIKDANKNYNIDFSEIDCEKYSEKANNFNIIEYPTIYLVNGVTKFEYDANLSEDTLNIFINTVMKQ